MNKQVKQILLIVLAILLIGELAFLGFRAFRGEEPHQPDLPPAAASSPTGETMEAFASSAPSEVSATEVSEAPTEASTEPKESRYVLTFTGDCTFGSTAEKWSNGYGFVKTVGENFNWPFENLRPYFEADDFTIINLEGPLTDGGTPADKQFVFRGLPDYTRIMTGASVEAVTLANNHARDYGQTGYNNTVQALTNSGIAYVERDGTALYTTESGLTIGLYAASFSFRESSIRAAISGLREQGAEIVVCAFHWGDEGTYRPNGSQEYFGRLAIEAGADIVWGHHPHVLQKIERYGNGVIFYSLGNCSFGGNTYPKDYDSAIVQQEVIRGSDGTVRLGELTIVPISLSSVSGRNNYQPTPLQPDTEAYARVLSKLDGSFRGADLISAETAPPTQMPTVPAETEETGVPETAAPEIPTGEIPGSTGAES